MHRKKLHGWLPERVYTETGNPLELETTDEDKFIQAVENPRQDFVIGVQWHPEYMPYSRHQRRLFNAFSKAVRSSENSLTLADDKSKS